MNAIRMFVLAAIPFLTNSALAQTTTKSYSQTTHREYRWGNGTAVPLSVPPPDFFVPGFEMPPLWFSRGPIVPKVVTQQAWKGYRHSSSISMSRVNDRFEARRVDNGIEFTVRGTVADDKATPSEIRIREAGRETRFTSLTQIPTRHLAVVRGILREAEAQPEFSFLP